MCFEVVRTLRAALRPPPNGSSSNEDLLSCLWLVVDLKGIPKNDGLKIQVGEIYVKIEQKYLDDIRSEMNTHNSHDKN